MLCSAIVDCPVLAIRNRFNRTKRSACGRGLGLLRGGVRFGPINGRGVCVPGRRNRGTNGVSTSVPLLPTAGRPAQRYALASHRFAREFLPMVTIYALVRVIPAIVLNCYYANRQSDGNTQRTLRKRDEAD